MGLNSKALDALAWIIIGVLAIAAVVFFIEGLIQAPILIGIVAAGMSAALSLVWALERINKL